MNFTSQHQIIKRALFVSLIIFNVDYSNIIHAKGRFSELIFTFKENKKFSFEENQKENSITLTFKKTHPVELNTLEHYDETLIKRVLVKDLEIEGSIVKLFLRDKHLKVTIDEVHEPYRVIVNIFDAHYEQEYDPVTGIPFVMNKHKDNVKERNLDDYQEVKDGFSEEQSSDFTEQSPLFQSDQSDSKLDGDKKVRQLLQPVPDKIIESDEIELEAQHVPEGKGQAWETFPIYMYPIQLAAFTGRKNPNGWSNKDGRTTLSSAEIIAEYAYKMFSFGHEQRALFAYLQVLQQDPSIFQKDPLHLWAFAESHLSQNNLELAKGYYQAVQKYFPESLLSKYSQLRILDIYSIDYINNDVERLSTLVDQLELIESKNDIELDSQKLIRLAYWSRPRPNNFKDQLPISTQESLSELEVFIPKIISKVTSFISSSIFLFNSLQENNPWKDEYSVLTENYLKTYDPVTGKPFYSNIKNLYKKRLVKLISTLYEQKKYAETVASYEKIPKSLKDIDHITAWKIAESYRYLGQDKTSLNLYKMAFTPKEEGLKKFKPLFWLTVLSSRVAEVAAKTSRANEATELTQQSKTYDHKLFQTWKELNAKEQQEIRVSYKSYLEDTLNDQILLETPPRLILSNWESALKTDVNMANNNESIPWKQAYTPTAATIYLLKSLIHRFRELGLNPERIEANKLLKHIPIASFKEDREAQKIWLESLMDLAEEYRKNNEYLEAGRLYQFAANSEIEWKDRAEAFYKGGLLLYRSGKREEAIQSLTRASQDGDNLFYANLAKERLNQFNP